MPGLRGSRSWLLLPSGSWLSAVPGDPRVQGAFDSHLPPAFYATYDVPWLHDARLESTLRAAAAVEQTDLLGPARAAGYTRPASWSLRVSIAQPSGALLAVRFAGRVSSTETGSSVGFTETLTIVRSARSLPSPRS